jgi:hypothetical protein
MTAAIEAGNEGVREEEHKAINGEMRVWPHL